MIHSKTTESTARRGNTLPNVDDVYPLSPLQEGMLFESLQAVGDDPYVQQLVIPLAAAADLERLSRAFEQVVAATPVLRTCFVWEGLRDPVQVVRSQVELAVRAFDWRTLALPETALEDFLASERRRGFQLNRAPLVRVALATTATGALLVLTSHHLLLDGWSLPLVMADWMRAYRTPDLPLTARPHFRDYVSWVRAQDPAAAKEFFREVLRGANLPTTLALPRPQLAAAEVGERYREIGSTLSVAESAAVRSLARRLRVTESTLVLGAISLVLARYTDRQDLVLGMTVAGRAAPLAGVEAMVGNLINTLPVRVRLDPARAFPLWLADLQREVAAIRRYEWAPLVEVVQAAELPPGVPLFEILYVYQNFPVDGALVANAEGAGARNPQYRDRTNYPLTLWAQPEAQLHLAAYFEAARFSRWHLENLLAQIRTVLVELSAAPERTLGQVSAPSPAERAALAQLSQGQQVDWQTPVEAVHALIEAQVDCTPDRIAARDAAVTVSYRELERRANRVAHSLADLGVGPGVLLGICCERNLELLIAVLGALQAGAAYVPLDPRYPESRSQQILTQSGIRLVLSDRAGEAHLQRMGTALGPQETPTVRRVGALLAASAQATRPQWTGQPEDLAYAIFTSGSTGRPKGALVEHRGKVNHLLAKNLFMNLQADDVVAQTASPCFDISVWQLLGALTVGARVELVAESVVSEPEQLLAQVFERRISVIEVVPSYLALLLTLPATPHNMAGLSWLVSTGEALPPELCRSFLQRVPGIPVLNAYGPAECSDDATLHAIRSPLDLDPESCPIGVPIANFRVCLLAQDGELSPSGVPGEIWIGGCGVGRGYLNDAQLTTRAFAPAPTGLGLVGRAYRTGDLGRLLPNGLFAWVGRVDHQLKVRGCLVQPTEIEHVLAEHPAIAAAVVLSEPRGSDEVRLLAAVVARPEQPRPEPAAVRAFLRTRLPDYMVPSVVGFVDEIPKTPNGKTDRAALAARVRRAAPAAAARPAQTELERRVAAIFGEVLRREPPGLDENFYELGGHSLLAMRLAARLQTELGRTFSVRQVFTAPTVGEMSALLADLPQQSTAPPGQDLGAETPAAAPDDETAQLRAQLAALGLLADPESLIDLYPLTPAQLGMYQAGQASAEIALYTSPAVLELKGSLTPAVLSRALDWLVARHPALRSTFFELASGPVQGVRRSLSLNPAWLDWRGLSAASQEQALAQFLAWDRDQGFPLAQGPLVRVTVIRHRNAAWWLCWSNHHLIADGWSWDLLFGELLQAIDAVAQTGQPPLLETAVPYRAFVDWLRAQDSTASRQYWQRQLAGFARPTLAQIVPRPVAAEAQPAGFAVVTGTLPRASWDQFTRSQQLTLAAPIQAALALTLAAESGENDVLFGTIVAGRPLAMPAAFSIVGMFLNVVPVRVQLTAEQPLPQLLRDLHRAQSDHLEQQFLAAVDYQALSAVPAGEPLSEVVLVVQEDVAPPPATPFALELTGVRSPYGRTQFPLLVEVTPGKELEIRFVVRTERLPVARAQDLYQRFLALLAQMILAGPDATTTVREFLSAPQSAEAVHV